MEGEEILVDWLRNYRDNYGSGVLSWAVKNSDQEAVKLLLEAGAEPDETNARGETPLLTSLDQGNEDLIRIFLEAGADTEKKGFRRKYPTYESGEHRKRSDRRNGFCKRSLNPEPGRKKRRRIYPASLSRGSRTL